MDAMDLYLPVWSLSALVLMADFIHKEICVGVLVKNLYLPE